jgi:hypothetical protein
VLLFVDDCFFERLLNESAAGPLTRDDLDVSAVGDNSNLWVDVCKAFTDDGYGIPPIPVSHRFFIDRGTNQVFDISRCTSRWVTPGKLRKWYNTAHNALVMYRAKYDRSGKHDFDSEEGLEEFVSSYCHGNRDCCFLAVLANWRGDSALDWFSAELPKDVEVVDGFDEEVSPMFDTQSVSEYSSLRGGSKCSTEDGSDIARIVNAMKRGSDESPEKKAYFLQKTKVLQVEEQNKKRKASEDKRRSDVTLARELRREYKALESDDEEQSIVIKNRLKTASLGMLSRLLDEVEGDLAGGEVVREG